MFMRKEDVTFDAHENLTISPKRVDGWRGVTKISGVQNFIYRMVPNLECIDTRIRIALNRGL